MKLRQLSIILTLFSLVSPCFINSTTSLANHQFNTVSTAHIKTPYHSVGSFFRKTKDKTVHTTRRAKNGIKSGARKAKNKTVQTSRRAKHGVKRGYRRGKAGIKRGARRVKRSFQKDKQ